MRHRPRRRFGQNFLHEGAYVRRMVQAIAPRRSDHVVEIGPGEGVLTEALLPEVGRFTAVEIDRDLIPGLQRLAGHFPDTDFRLIEADALEVAPAELAIGGERLRLVGNLPYNVSTPLLFHLTDPAAPIADLHVLLQREVVERMAAAPGGRTYGRLSVMIQYRCTVEPLFDVPPGAFRPPPKVTSTFVRLCPHPAAPVEVPAERALDTVVARAFSARRKTLRNALKGLISAETIAAAGLDPGQRPETLSLEGFAALARTLAANRE
ncbi:16S rRNA (adenine(1518)-N(6)/adenine(1519)-N(6))-dimethyltransferase RsmA [Arhodomonas sp. SL1]|uniref:16S rRNA (adenine(1518)-N(6)/adenine(1519)-N(6))- dimethyltransferase RsmA n=1 Tax=Arhodomonas sp. SL1 TaxID=3425691 RepID=UPI003F8831E3